MEKIKKLLVFGLIFALVSTCFSSCKPKKSKYDEEETEVSTELTEDMIERPILQPKLKEAMGKYADAVGWINIPGTNIDYPVMQSQKDYTPAAGSEGFYYSRHSEDKKYRLEGSIFTFKECNFESRKKLSRNTVIMGHNMWDDTATRTMFSQLLKHFEINFANEHPYIFLSLPEQDLVFQIFAVYITEVPFRKYSPKAAFNYYSSDYMNSDGKTVKGGDGSLPVNIPKGKKYSYAQVVAAEAKKRSLYNYPVQVGKNSKIITLSTCTYKYGKTDSKNCKTVEFVIQGKLLPASKKLADKAYLTKNENPKPPQGLPEASDFVYECEGKLITEEDGKVVTVEEDKVKEKTAA